MRSCIKSRMKEYKHQFVLFCFLGKEKDGFTIDKRLYNGIDGHSFFFNENLLIQTIQGPPQGGEAYRASRTHRQDRQADSENILLWLLPLRRKCSWESLDGIWLIIIIISNDWDCIHATWSMAVATCQWALHSMLLTSTSGRAAVSCAITMNDFQQVRGSWRKICCCGVELSISKIPSP